MDIGNPAQLDVLRGIVGGLGISDIVVIQLVLVRRDIIYYGDGLRATGDWDIRILADQSIFCHVDARGWCPSEGGKSGIPMPSVGGVSVWDGRPGRTTIIACHVESGQLRHVEGRVVGDQRRVMTATMIEDCAQAKPHQVDKVGYHAQHEEQDKVDHDE